MAQGPRGMVDMARSRAEKEEILNPPELDPIDFVGDYPPGLCLCLDEETLEKLDLDDDIVEGDTLDIRAFAEVTNVTPAKNGSRLRVECQIVRMVVENEDTEDEMTGPADRRYRK
jgi:hypothetical protein